MKTPEAIAQECAEKAMELVRGWWLGRTSEENCLTTIVDVFTDMRNDLESDKLKPEMSAIIAAAIREATEQNDGEIKRLKADNDSLRTLWTEIRTVLIQSRAANCVCSYGAQQADAVEAANAVLKRMPPDVTNENTQLRAALNVAEGALKYTERQVREVWKASDTYNEVHRSWCLEELNKALARIIAARSGKANTSDSPTDS